MYQKSIKGLWKHLDFLLIDLFCLELSFWLAFSFRQTSVELFQEELYRNMFLVLFLVEILVVVFFDTMGNVLKRGFYKEFVVTVQNVLIILLITTCYLFLTKQADQYSRIIWVLTGVLYFTFSYISRVLWKHHLKSRIQLSEGKRSLIVVSTKESVGSVIDRILENNYERFFIKGLVIVDADMEGRFIQGIQVVANADTAVDFICRHWIDEVFVYIPFGKDMCSDLIEKLICMGLTVHLNISELGRFNAREQFVEKMSSFTVLTYSINSTSTRQAFVKRVIDIWGGVVGCLLTVIIAIIIGPIIFIQSPGPIFFSQERVGKNGRIFKLYKFRSMYMDAEERKKELMDQNRVGDGRMFKLENDPRIIGSEKGPGKGIGNFIRKTSLDEFPQFWNVLKGDMSLVGTRPPTLDEWNLYDLHHRARLSVKPGLTGMWQISGRSEITDFEDVVKLDTEYIEKWNIGLDIKILLKTVLVVIKGKGSM